MRFLGILLQSKFLVDIATTSTFYSIRLGLAQTKAAELRLFIRPIENAVLIV